MREYDSNWLSKCNDEELLPPEELMPLSQSLITPDLALAFDISNPNTAADGGQSPSVIRSPLGLSHPNSGEFDVDSGELGSGGGCGDDTARTLKRPRLVWTPQLHKRFVEAVAQLGIKNAVPKTIMQLMNVDGLTRENVASHLQKYRLYLKRMQGLNGGNGVAAGFGGGSDAATERLFASSPVPAQFLHPGRHNSEQFLPYAPLATLQRQQMVTAVGHHQLQNQFNKQMNFGMNGQFEHSYMATRYGQQPVHRMGQTTLHNSVPGYVEDMESASGNGGRKVLTLFPMGDN